MDMYGGGSLSTSPPPDCFPDSSSNSQQHLPPPAPDHDFDFFSHFPSLHSDEAAELEWLSQFVDDTTSFHDFPPNNHTLLHLQPSSHTTATTTSFPDDIPNSNNENKKPSPSSSHYSHAHSTSSSSSTSGSAMKSRSKRQFNGSGGGGGGGMVRRCSHCASEKTPQWRTGPLGPKTLCNACGVRFKSGRLVPEYRPAASPTFVLTQHSNSHRKVMELRRQKELLRQQQQQQQHDFKVC